jgi:hypothetical protein
LKALHLFLKDFGELLAPMAVYVPEQAARIEPEDSNTLRYAVRCKDNAGFIFLNNYQDHVVMHDQEGIALNLELPDEAIVLPQDQGLTLRKDSSAILPFNLILGRGILLKYATAQLLTKLRIADQTSYVFFAPKGMRSEFVLDRASYRSVEVAGGQLKEEGERSTIQAEAGLHCRIQITAVDGTTMQLLILTQEQAYTCWKVRQDGEDLLILSEALVLEQEGQLQLCWRGQETVQLVSYPPLNHEVVGEGQLSAEQDGFFTRYVLSVAKHTTRLQLQSLDTHRIRVSIPPMAQDAFLCIDYLGDTGHAYLNGRLVSDHFRQWPALGNWAQTFYFCRSFSLLKRSQR